jgi:hypothetical protein
LKVKDDFLAGGCFKVQSGEQVKFWKDIWLGDKPLREAYPNLFRIVRKKDDTVANVLRTVPLNVSFRRGLVNANLNSWFDVVSKVVMVNLKPGTDLFRWNLTKNGFFTVRSMYRSMIKQGILKENNTL